MEETRYLLLPSGSVPNGGQGIIRVGLPIHTDMIPNICITCKGSYECINLNSNVLRQALLANVDLTKELLGLEVIPYTELEEQEPESEEQKVDNTSLPKETKQEIEPKLKEEKVEVKTKRANKKKEDK